jgi:hypothetical protein
MIEVSKWEGGAVTATKFQQPKLIDNGATKFTRIESIIDFGTFFELVFVNDKVSPPTRAAFRMASETYEKLCEHVERIALEKAAELQELRPDESAHPNSDEPE